MQVLRTIAGMRAARLAAQGTFGLVPTMGSLHEGHLSLIRRCKAENDVCAAWIFVNPAQFGPNEDFERYPRDETRDLELLAQEGVDLVFLPAADEIYPSRFSSYVVVEGVTERLEGASRPGYFRGVATVVTKFFHLMRPDRAYFGQKDGQQVVVLRKMVQDLDFDVDMVTCPTVREGDGLAMSSRNAYLSREERQAATVLYRALLRALDLWGAGERRGDALRREMRAILETEPLAGVDYVSVADPLSLDETEEATGPALASLAVRIGKTRLIDNVVLP